jgi:predicted nuclease of predicted toxin-antitoxin system
VRFLVDECTGPTVARWLREQSHEVFSVFDDARGMADDAILDKAHTENWVLITNDKGFGERIYLQQHPHHGIVLLRLANERASAKIEALRKLLDVFATQITDRFVVVTENQVRIG